MKEREMRARIERLLENAIRKSAAPMSLGVALALTGCGSSEEVMPLYSAPVPPDSGDVVNAPDSDTGTGPVVRYMAQIPDGDRADAKSDTGPAMKYMAQYPDADPADVGAIAVYSAPMPDANVADARHPDAADARDDVLAKYMAPLPDADGKDVHDSGPAMRYMAQFPDAT